ncbi:hypothetical protein AmaxDRAFT_3938 [Limnospira maxima CS-328]|uniref:Uncharacterized protein n=1 Tax=Limnospira maxima CS-328 TaxID=513049 RepID=B5W589_LIMMA|nr:hypothetical protein AmaxDRAFT_3938 [Limnospira maxima CS-328]
MGGGDGDISLDPYYDLLQSLLTLGSLPVFGIV